MPEDEEEPQDFEDALVQLRAMIDQMVASVPEQARASKGIYDAYIGQGFSEEQAFDIVRIYIYEWLSGDSDDS